jgi:hypothetical protein
MYVTYICEHKIILESSTYAFIVTITAETIVSLTQYSLLIISISLPQDNAQVAELWDTAVDN